MKAYQCDRCFKYYTENKEVVIPGRGTDVIATGMSIMRERQGSSVAVERNYELCDDCLQELVDWAQFKEIKHN